MARSFATMRPVPPSNHVLQDLRNTYANGNLVVFVGAGISAAAGLPSWLGLAQQLSERLRSEGASRTLIEEIDGLIQTRQLVDALSALRHALGPQEFDLAVEKALDDRGKTVPDIAMAVAALEPKLRAVITTNIDGLLERAFGGRWPALASPTGDLAQKTQYILKLHGTLLDRRTWVFVREQYDRASFGWPLQRSTFETIFRAYSILFVGYGLADDDLDLTLGITRALAGEQPPTHFALLQGPVSSYRLKKLQDAGIRILEYESHDEVPAMLRSLIDLATPNP